MSDEPKFPVEYWARCMYAPTAQLGAEEREHAGQLAAKLGRDLAQNLFNALPLPNLRDVSRTPVLYLETVLESTFEPGVMPAEALALWREGAPLGRYDDDFRVVGFLAAILTAIEGYEADLRARCATLVRFLGCPEDAVTLRAHAAGGRAIMHHDGNLYAVYPKAEAERLAQAYLIDNPSVVLDRADLLLAACGLPAECAPMIEGLQFVPQEKADLALAALIEDPVAFAQAVLAEAVDWTPYIMAEFSDDAVQYEFEDALVIRILAVNAGAIDDPSCLTDDEDDGTPDFLTPQGPDLA